MAYCLPRHLADSFLQKLKSGEINPGQLAEMTSQQRRDYFSQMMGEEHAKNTNALFESKLLLKNQQKGMISWAKTVAGLKPDARRDIITRVEKMDNILHPANEQEFLEDLVAHKLKTTVTMEEAAQISDLAKGVSDSKKVMENAPRRDNLGKPTAAELKYGRQTVAFKNYVDNAKAEAKKLSISDRMKPENIGKNLVDFAGLAKSAKATLDNSYLLRQGLKGFWSNPRIWFRNAKKSFVDAARVAGNKPVMDEIMADIFSRPNYDNYVKDKVAIGTIEEEFPGGDVLEKIPAFGRLHKMAETTFKGLAYRNRADFYDYFANIAEKQGNKEVTGLGIGRLVNSLTGRGHLGVVEPVAHVLNVGFFSPRLLKSNIDFLTAHYFDKKVDPFVKKQAAKNLAKTVIGTAGVLGMAYAINPDSVEWDPKSADFGKIKVGNTRFDITGGMGSIAVLASRIATKEMKSSTTGVVHKLNTGEYGALTRADMIYNFFENKLAPAASVIWDMVEGEDFEGNKPSIKGTLKNLFVPIIVEQYFENMEDPESADALLTVILDGVGIGANTYSMSSTDWTQSTGKVLTQFREKVGDKKFKEANEKYNKMVNSWFANVQNDSRYKKLSTDDKQKLLTKKKLEIREKIFKKYFFKYKPEKSAPLPNL